MKNWIASLVSGGVKDVAEGIGGLAIDLRTAISGKDPIQKGELEKFTRELEALAGVAQTEVNKIEAAHHSIFVAGARPFILWVCGLGLAYNFLIHPFIVWGVLIAGLDIIPPVLNTNELIPLVLGLLGLGGFRTYEKIKKVQDRH